MRNCVRMFAVTIAALALAASVASATEYSSFTVWAANELGSVPGGSAPDVAFGTVQASWPAAAQSVVGLAYDANSVWVANESGGRLIEQSTVNPYPVIRSFNILGYGLTIDGNQDGASVDGARLLVTDFQGDLNLHDDIIMSINRASGALNEFWNVDGAMNPNPNANINTILGICVDGSGGIWVSNNEGLIKKITLGAAGQWTQISSQAVPGGGSWGEIDYDRCLDMFFATNFQLNRHQFHQTLTTPPLATFPGVGASQTAITSNNNGVVYTSGFGTNIITQHEGIACQTTAVEPTTWGSLKASYR